MRVKGREDDLLIGGTSPGLLLDAALIGATEDTEEALLSPVVIPAVGADPVLDTILLTIAKKLDGVTTLIRASLVLIDTSGIAVEISINLEGNLEGTVGGDLSLHVLLTDDGVGLLALMLVLVPIKRSVTSALLLALRSDHASVVTSSVRIALISDNTSLAVISPGAARLTTVAGTAAGEGATGAAVHILSRELAILVSGDVDTITHGLDGTESPAGTAVLLVTNLLHGLGIRPLGAGIERRGSSSDLSSRVLLNPPGVGVDVLKVDTKKTTSLALGHTSDGVVGSLPGSLGGVDLTDKLRAHGDLLSEGNRGDESKSNDELVHSR